MAEIDSVVSFEAPLNSVLEASTVESKSSELQDKIMKIRMLCSKIPENHFLRNLELPGYFLISLKFYFLF